MTRRCKPPYGVDRRAKIASVRAAADKACTFAISTCPRPRLQAGKLDVMLLCDHDIEAGRLERLRPDPRRGILLDDRSPAGDGR